MRTLAIFVLGLVATASDAANTITKGTVQTCSPSQNAVIAVTKLGEAVPGVHLEIYREIQNGERPAWSGLTDKNGIATLIDLRPGRYRVFADAGLLDATMYLTVAEDAAGESRCEIKLTPPEAAERPPVLAKQTASITVHEFRGVVQDESGAVIPRAKVRVLRNNHDHAELASTRSNERGQFSLPLQNGTYLAVFDVAGFKQQAIGITVAKDGWNG